MTFNKEPLKTLTEWVNRILENGLIPTEAELVQQVILGNEIEKHPEFAVMDYVESKYSLHQLDTGNRDTYVAVMACYKIASGTPLLETTWNPQDFIITRLLERNY